MLDEYGLFGACCARHGTPLAAVSMDGPEKFTYADSLMVNILKRFGVQRKYYVFYDINCSYQVNCKVSFVINESFSLRVLKEIIGTSCFLS
jgi:hypothetical protein